MHTHAWAVAALLCAAAHGKILRPSAPMMGWNSYDWGNGSATYGSPNFNEIIDSADGVAQYLLPHGYEYFMVDGGWYFNGGGRDMDEYGRATPSLDIYPELEGSWARVKRELDKRKLKFGLWMTDGMPTEAFAQNLPVKGTQYRAQDVAVKDANGNPVPGCSWNAGVYRVNTSHPGGVAYYKGIVEQMEEWGLDYVKLDCVFAANMLEDDVRLLSTLMDASKREFVLGLSPGDGATEEQLLFAKQYATTARIATDLWPNWHQVHDHYQPAADMAHVAGAEEGFYLDLDIIPFGKFRGQQEPEAGWPFWPPIQRSIFTLWTMTQSPLLYGGDVRNPARCPNPPVASEACGINNHTIELLTNDAVIAVSRDLRHSRMIVHDETQWTWAGDSAGQQPKGSKYVAVFNTWCGIDPSKADPPCGPPGGNMNGTVSTEISAESVGLSENQWYNITDVWRNETIGYFKGKWRADTSNLGAMLMVLNPIDGPPQAAPKKPAPPVPDTKALYNHKFWPQHRRR